MMQLVVVAAFDRGEDDQLLPAFEAMEMGSVAKALAVAEDISKHHDGVIAWSRSADPDIGEYGPPKILAVYGDVPEME